MRRALLVRLAERGDHLLERLHLAAARRGRRPRSTSARRPPARPRRPREPPPRRPNSVTSRSQRSDISAGTLASRPRERRADGAHLLLVAGLDPVVLVVRQLHVRGQRAPHYRRRGRAVVVDAGRDHVADEERRVVAPVAGRSPSDAAMCERAPLAHTAPARSRPTARPCGAQRGQDDRRQRPTWLSAARTSATNLRMSSTACRPGSDTSARASVHDSRRRRSGIDRRRARGSPRRSARSRRRGACRRWRCWCRT